VDDEQQHPQPTWAIVAKLVAARKIDVSARNRRLHSMIP
jgi:hypothetical protein